MSNRFKFRVWDNVEEEYIEDLDIIRLTQYGKFVFNNAENNTEPELNPKRFIFEQCTGLRDKNGKLIFEGDVVIYEVYVSDWSDEKRKGFGVIYYDEEQHALGLRTIKQTFTSSFGLNKLISKLEVIGNIHENPELGKEEE